MSAATTIGVVMLVMALGVAAQLLADRFRVPSVAFLILAGVIVGPEFLGLVTPEVFGDSLPVIVGLSVAIIVFEGAFHLKLERIREAPKETIRLVTIGAVISFLATSLVIHYFLGASWEVSLLIGALLIATGPTVITPIVNVVAVRERVASLLETEGVVNDVTAAILAIVMFESVVRGSQGLPRIITEFLERLAVGVIVGLLVAGVVWYVLNHIDLSTDNAPQNARMVVLVSSLTMYGFAEMFASEAGIAAVAIGGFVLGNTNIPYRDTVEQFKGDITLIVIAFVFITLASLLSISDLVALGIGGIVLVIFVALVIRPAMVMLCTKSGTLTFRERIFVSALGPRGIIPASVATLFALELQSSNPEAADTLVGAVFLVIFATVVFEGGLARHIAQRLGVIPMRAIIVGGGRVGKELAERLEDRGEDVLIIESQGEVIEELRDQGFSVHIGDGTRQNVLKNAGIENSKIVVAATGDDDVNLLIGQISRNKFGIEKVIARVNEPENLEAFRDIDIQTVSTSISVAQSIDNIIERPGISQWMTQLDRDGDVQEVEVTSKEHVGKTVSELNSELPEGCHIALISREGHNKLPHPNDEIKNGDHLTFLGRKESVREALDYCKN